jgi:hypothetical protein
MTTIVRRRKLGMKSVKGICDASTTGIQFANNYEVIPHDDVYIRWGCTSNVPGSPVAGGEHQIINSAKAIHRVADKTGFRVALNEVGLCPPTWFDFESWLRDNWDHLEVVGDAEKCPKTICRTRTHAQGRGLWTYEHPELVEEFFDNHPDGYANLFIDKVAEFRVFVMQGRVVWVAEKTPGNPEDVAWNVAKGGRFDNVRWGDWNINVLQNALDSWELSKLHFSGIDVMLDKEGQAWCVEANSAPSQTSPYRQSCVAKAFDWMVNNNKYNRREFDETVVLDWKDAIHPGVKDVA